MFTAWLDAPDDAEIRVVWEGDPFEFSTRAAHVFIRGHEAGGDSCQDLLTKRYVPVNRE